MAMGIVKTKGTQHILSSFKGNFFKHKYIDKTDKPVNTGIGDK
jgi:hypothetical protein